MEDSKNTNDIHSTQDFEMGGSNPQQPQINRYDQQQQPTTPPQATNPGQVNPSGPAPQSAQVDQTQAVPAAQPAATPAVQAATNPGQKPNPPVKPPQKPGMKKKALITLIAVFAGFLLVFLVLAFFFIAQAGGAVENPIAQLLGLNQATFVNGLITFIHIIFFLFSLLFFVLTMVGLFKASMAKKDDKETKKSGLKTSIIFGLLLVFIVISWGFSYVYLDSKRIPTGPEAVAPDIITDPEVPLDLTAPVEVRFDAGNITFDSRKYQIVSHEWDFGDGEKGTSQIVSHRYQETGVYDVGLIITIRDKDTGEVGIGGEYHTTVSVTNQALSAVFTADPQEGEAPLEVEFDASESTDPDGYIDTYEWDFDDDGQFDDGTGENVSHTFDKIGKYTVSLRVTSTTGEFDVAEKIIEVMEENSPEAVITIVDEPETLQTNTSYVFKADESSSPNGNIETYEWDFGDGSKLEKSKTVSHSFSVAGTYEVTLTVVDEEDKETSTTMTVRVGNPSSGPKAVINSEPVANSDQTIIGRSPLTVTFDAGNSTDLDNDIVEYAWDTNGDGTDDKFGETIKHTFSQEGTYTVTLTVTDSEDNISKSTVTVEVAAQGIVANLSADKVDGSAPLTVSFDASASSYQNGQITSYKWNFGDNTPEKFSTAKITHKYTSIGTYTARVTAIGADNTSSSAEITITVREIPLNACFTSVFSQGEAPLETSFDPSCSSGTISKYFWDFGDGGTSTKVKPIHTFEEPGEYTVELEISDSDNNISVFQLQISVSE